MYAILSLHQWFGFILYEAKYILHVFTILLSSSDRLLYTARKLALCFCFFLFLVFLLAKGLAVFATLYSFGVLCTLFLSS